jgi:hypothetical protein
MERAVSKGDDKRGSQIASRKKKLERWVCLPTPDELVSDGICHGSYRHGMEKTPDGKKFSILTYGTVSTYSLSWGAAC